MTRSMRLKNSGRKKLSAALTNVCRRVACAGARPSCWFAADVPRFEVITITAFEKSAVRPSASVSRPSPVTCSSRSNTSGWAFSISSSSTTANGWRRTAAVSRPSGSSNVPTSCADRVRRDVLVHVEPQQPAGIAEHHLGQRLARTASCPRRSGPGTGASPAAGPGRPAGPWRRVTTSAAASTASSWPTTFAAQLATHVVPLEPAGGRRAAPATGRSSGGTR